MTEVSKKVAGALSDGLVLNEDGTAVAGVTATEGRRHEGQEREEAEAGRAAARSAAKPTLKTGYDQAATDQTPDLPAFLKREPGEVQRGFVGVTTGDEKKRILQAVEVQQGTFDFMVQATVEGAMAAVDNFNVVLPPEFWRDFKRRVAEEAEERGRYMSFAYNTLVPLRVRRGDPQDRRAQRKGGEGGGA